MGFPDLVIKKGGLFHPGDSRRQACWVSLLETYEGRGLLLARGNK